MHFRIHTHQKVLSLTILLCVFAPLAAFGAPGVSELSGVKDSFDSLWHTARDTGKRRADLEHSLATFDSKVASAKQDLLRAAIGRRDNSRRLEERKKLIDVLQQQLHAAAESRGFYESLAATQKGDIVSFIRYSSGRQTAERESGPSVGGAIVKTLLRGSLGENVDIALGDRALLLAREHFASQIGVLVTEADKAQERIRTVLDDLNGQVDGLEERGKDLGAKVDATMTYIDNSWRQKKLNEEELRHVLQETAEANAKITEMQPKLGQIGSELHDTKLKQLRADLADVQKRRAELPEAIAGLERKDKAMQLLQDTAKQAEEKAATLRNTDPKIFKRIEEANLRLQQLQSDAAPVDDIDRLKEEIALMKTGVPEDAAVEAIRTKHLSLELVDARRDLASQISVITQDIAMLDASIVVKRKQLQVAEKASQDLASLSPMFTWPVRGSITAGYHDADYVKVFGVPHQAIDIAVPQATPIHVVSPGIVFAVKDGGKTGYSYILVGHEGGYASLYGHVSASFVKAGQKVGYGEIIGLTGGKPGSHGAGHMTTGAHLHLEMTKNGVHVNPLGVLQ